VRLGSLLRRTALTPGEWVPALLLVLVGQQEVWAPLPGSGFPHPESWLPWHALGYLLTASAVCLRRRHPVGVLALIASVSAVEYLVAGAPEGLGTFLPILVSVYAVGRYAPVRELATAGPLALLAIAVHELRDPQFELDGPAVILWAALVMAYVAGHQLRRHSLRTRHATEAAVEQARAAVSDERSRIARDLHDVVGHAVGVIVVQAVAGTGQLDKGRYDGVRERLAAIEDTARQALTEMRRLVDVLDTSETSHAPAPTGESIDDLIDRVRGSGLETTLVTMGDRRALPPGIGLTVYRVVQEALTNTLKHSDNGPATVTLTYHRDAVEVDIVDSGRARARKADASHAGRGIAGMRERVALYSGRFEAGYAPGGGFRVRAHLPCPAESA
jgi:signal transduction histidine kinase